MYRAFLAQQQYPYDFQRDIWPSDICQNDLSEWQQIQSPDSRHLCPHISAIATEIEYVTANWWWKRQLLMLAETWRRTWNNKAEQKTQMSWWQELDRMQKNRWYSGSVSWYVCFEIIFVKFAFGLLPGEEGISSLPRSWFNLTWTSGQNCTGDTLKRAEFQNTFFHFDKLLNVCVCCCGFAVLHNLAVRLVPFPQD